jgi:AcrR family transcriptional regulator
VAGVAGQGRKFAVDDALEAATMVFWRYGYEGSSLKMLTEAMGIKPPSLYSAFGSKEDLFFTVVRHYNDTHGRFAADAMTLSASGIELVHRLLREAAKHYARPEFPSGCLTISAAVTVTPDNQHVAERLADMRNANVAAIAQALDHDVATGRLPRSTATGQLAAFVGATLQGMSQQARDGASAAQLRAIAEVALNALPASRSESLDPRGPRS